MPNHPLLPSLLAFCLGLPALASAAQQPPPLSAPQLAQVEPLYAFAHALEKATGYLGVAEWMEKTGLQLLLLPATQTAWKQKGLALDKPFVLETPAALACMGVADSKALAAAVKALPGEAKTTQKATLHYRPVSTGPRHHFLLFWNASLLCIRPHQPPAGAAAPAAAPTATPAATPPSSPPRGGPPLPAKELEETLAKAAALSKTVAQQTWPMAIAQGTRIQMEPLSSKQLKLRVHLANAPWKINTAKKEKTAMAPVSADTGVLLKLYGIPAAEILRHMDFISALSPRGDVLLAQKQAWFARLAPLLADEFLAKVDYPEGRNSERLLLLAKINPGAEAEWDTWLAQRPKDEAAGAFLPTRRGPLVFARKGPWAFATLHEEWALSQIEQLEKSKPEAMAHVSALAFPKGLGAIFQGETFISAALGLGPRQIRMLMFNAPLKNLMSALGPIKAQAHLAEHSTELLVELSLVP
ncbi:MAG: hypothetical protein FWC28_00805 [Proteobacteria bacterium]|nr:hypothetical protein [Cystobacterineae bacterium]MCL2313782.1 hypothetical protein [Pseudomonadota bacterium]